MFTRWHNHPLSEDEIKYALYDLNEAQYLTKDINEIQRIRDLQAYVHLFGLYYKWAKDKKDENALKSYFDYVYLSSTRNLINSNALFKSYERYINKGSVLYNKYISSYKPKDWCPFLKDETILKNFNIDLSFYGQELNDYKVLNLASIVETKFDSNSFFGEMTFNLAMRQEFSLLTQDNLYLQVEEKSSESLEKQALITITNQDYSFALTRLLRMGENWKISLPKRDIYTISMHRLNRCNIHVKGNFIPIISNNTSIPVKEKTYVELNLR